MIDPAIVADPGAPSAPVAPGLLPKWHAKEGRRRLRRHRPAKR